MYFQVFCFEDTDSIFLIVSLNYLQVKFQYVFFIHEYNEFKDSEV